MSKAVWVQRDGPKRMKMCGKTSYTSSPQRTKYALENNDKGDIACYREIEVKGTETLNSTCSRRVDCIIIQDVLKQTTPFNRTATHEDLQESLGGLFWESYNVTLLRKIIRKENNKNIKNTRASNKCSPIWYTYVEENDE